MKSAPSTCCTLVLLAICMAASAQTRKAEVFRCGPEGRELRDSPCPPGRKASSSQVEFDQPSAAAQQETRQRSREQARLADEMAREREHAEAQAARQRAGGIKGDAGPPEAPAEHGKPPHQSEPKKGHSLSKIKAPKPAKPASAP